jgi:hypothetical protein
MEQFYKFKINTVVVTAVTYSNIEWGSTPDYIECDLPRATLEKALRVSKFLKEVQYFKAEDLYGVSWELLAIDEDADYKEKEDQLPPLTNFEPEYRIGSSALKVYDDGDLQIVIHLKYSDEEIWAALGNVKDLLQKLEEHEHGND